MWQVYIIQNCSPPSNPNPHQPRCSSIVESLITPGKPTFLATYAVARPNSHGMYFSRYTSFLTVTVDAGGISMNVSNRGQNPGKACTQSLSGLPRLDSPNLSRLRHHVGAWSEMLRGRGRQSARLVGRIATPSIPHGHRKTTRRVALGRDSRAERPGHGSSARALGQPEEIGAFI